MSNFINMSKRSAKDKHFLKQPIYQGGKKAMDKLISKNLTYPKEALMEKIEGSVYLRYGIDYKGNVKETKVISSLGYGCDEEAERVVGLLKFEVPDVPRKMKVVFHKNIRIHFRLPMKKTKELHYSVSTSKTKEKESRNSNSYSYTITIN